ncbi:peptidoglycan editing factor PgeF [Candidatus Vondammii sp. HM_W22]|uniref:peptidoglycan editing factor PgeF n=1 Tax=Candidatus Vondammii sp. HM_W22 TaxID=2687299 RepID=UPI001F145316|nr:peptidoglycan editing factor PgeF [Candidatus Vondammii sp. HM_W22]
MTEALIPDWPAPEHVKAMITTRWGGYSQTPYDGMNLADHVGDDPGTVGKNRALLRQRFNLPAEPNWLQQVHGCQVTACDSGTVLVEADAVVAEQPGQVCAVMTADCLPLLICNESGSRVAAVHAGWRGLAAGVIEAALDRFDESGESLLVWLGPAIGPDRFEVGDDVRQQFLNSGQADESAFKPGAQGRWLADIYQLARIRLMKRNIGFVGGGDYCTVTEKKRFFSYRRDGSTGRMASLIWIDHR